MSHDSGRRTVFLLFHLAAMGLSLAPAALTYIRRKRSKWASSVEAGPSPSRKSLNPQKVQPPLVLTNLAACMEAAPEHHRVFSAS